MKPIYLILAHHAPDQFGRLIEAVGDVPVYVHVDVKTDDKDFKIAASGRSNVQFCNDRVNVKWGGWSVVEATLILLVHAMPSIKSEDYVVLLSGDSYPLRSEEHTRQFFARNAGNQFINLVALPSKEANKPLSRITRLYVEFDPRNGRNNFVHKAINKLGFPRNYRKALGGMTPYAGSTWWALTGDAIMWVMDQVRDNKPFIDFCRSTRVPDEFFFHTLIGNSPYSKFIKNSIIYADWSRPAGPKPAIMDAAHLESFSETHLMVEHRGYGTSRAIFARKFLNPDICKLAQKLCWTVPFEETKPLEQTTSGGVDVVTNKQSST